MGAVASIFGYVRDHNHGQRVVALEYSAYHALARKEGTRIVKKAVTEFQLGSAMCIHRLGRLQIGDMAVAIWTASVHRKEAFSACQWIIDEIKANVPIWKKETYVDGSQSWVICTHGEVTHL
jgi:molybdopterin synthase catalytic subunit